MVAQPTASTNRIGLCVMTKSDSDYMRAHRYITWRCLLVRRRRFSPLHNFHTVGSNVYAVGNRRVGGVRSVVDAMDGTGAALMAFLDWTGEKGLLTTANARAIKVGAKDVLEQAEGPDWESTDLRTIDVDDVVRCFETKRATKYTPKTLGAYVQRFRSAMNMYR